MNYETWLSTQNQTICESVSGHIIFQEKKVKETPHRLDSLERDYHKQHTGDIQGVPLADQWAHFQGILEISNSWSIFIDTLLKLLREENMPEK